MINIDNKADTYYATRVLACVGLLSFLLAMGRQAKALESPRSWFVPESASESLLGGPLDTSLATYEEPIATNSNERVSLVDFESPVMADEMKLALPEKEPWCWRIRPHGFIYSTYWASAAEPRMATHFISESSQGNLLDSHIAGRVGVLRYGPRNVPEGFQLDILGGAKLRQDWDDELDVMATDYRYDILGTFGGEQHRFKLGFYHVSSHAGDEFLLKRPGFNRLNFYRDVLVAGYSYYPVPQFRVYGEIGWSFHHELSQPLEFQFGFDYGPAYATGFAGAPFIAMNVHLREEVDFGGNFAAQAGWAWKGDQIDGLFRTGVYYYTGHSPQFSFYAANEEQIGWGLWYDF